jgi:membrane protein DedA with SNARE-associated domain/membrane-associated phospholipid phosphatase
MKPIPLVFAAAVVGWLIYKRKTMGRVEQALLALLAAATVVYGVGLIHPPSAESVIKQVGTTLGAWTYVLVGALAFLETGAGIGLIAPGEATILLGGFVAGQGKISVIALLAIVWTAAVAGDVTSYYLGRRLGREFLERHGPKVKITPERLETVEGFFAKWGGFAILLGRFVGLVRAIAPFLAGASKMPIQRFLPYDIVGAGLWGCGLVVLGYVFWRSFDQLLNAAKQGALALGLVIALVVGIVAAVRWLRVPGNRRAARAWLDRQPVLRPVARALEPAGALIVRLAPGRFGLEVTTVFAVALVGGFAFGALAGTVDSHPMFVDRRALDIADGLRFGVLDSAAKIVTWLGSLPGLEVATLLAAFVLFRRGHRVEALALIGGSILVIAGVHITKEILDRPRPVHRLISVTGSSYPSGHAAYSTAYLAIAVALARGTARVPAAIALLVAGLLLAGAIGLSRVYLRVHWWTDVVGGWGLGAACFAMSALIAVVIVEVRQNAHAPA